jgi:hypothetical protein
MIIFDESARLKILAASCEESSIPIWYFLILMLANPTASSGECARRDSSRNGGNLVHLISIIFTDLVFTLLLEVFLNCFLVYFNIYYRIINGI